jgi:hypothetical protein
MYRDSATAHGCKAGAWLTRTDSIECHVSSMTAEYCGGVGWTLQGESELAKDPFSFIQTDYLSDDVVLTVMGGLDLLAAPVTDSTARPLTSTGSPTSRLATVTAAASGPALPFEPDTRGAPVGNRSSLIDRIIGPVIGAVVGFCLIIVLAWWYWRRCHESAVASNHHPGGRHRVELEAPTNKSSRP